MASLIIFIAVFASIWFPGCHVLEMPRSVKKVGGLTFVRFGRLSFSYCLRSR